MQAVTEALVEAGVQGRDITPSDFLLLQKAKNYLNTLWFLSRAARLIACPGI